MGIHIGLIKEFEKFLLNNKYRRLIDKNDYFQLGESSLVILIKTDKAYLIENLPITMVVKYKDFNVGASHEFNLTIGYGLDYELAIKECIALISIELKDKIMKELKSLT